MGDPFAKGMESLLHTSGGAVVQYGKKKRRALVESAKQQYKGTTYGDYQDSDSRNQIRMTLVLLTIKKIEDDKPVGFNDLSGLPEEYIDEKCEISGFAATDGPANVPSSAIVTSGSSGQHYALNTGGKTINPFDELYARRPTAKEVADVCKRTGPSSNQKGPITYVVEPWRADQRAELIATLKKSFINKKGLTDDEIIRKHYLGRALRKAAPGKCAEIMFGGHGGF